MDNHCMNSGPIISKDAQILEFTYIIGNSVIGSGARIGPFATIRDSIIGEGCEIGNFVEIVRSNIGKGTKIKHLAYIGDSEIGENVNIGAGTITCNFDGKLKSKTKIGKGAFIGSNVTLIAPSVIGSNAYVAAGSIINKKKIPARSLVICRAKDLVIKRDYQNRK